MWIALTSGRRLNLDKVTQIRLLEFSDTQSVIRFYGSRTSSDEEDYDGLRFLVGEDYESREAARARMAQIDQMLGVQTPRKVIKRGAA